MMLPSIHSLFTASLLLGTTLLLGNGDCRFVSAFSADVRTTRRGSILSTASTKFHRTMTAIHCSNNHCNCNFNRNSDREPDEQMTDENNAPTRADFDPQRRKWFRDTFAAGTTIAAASTATAYPSSANAAQPNPKSRTDGYAVQYTEREWAYILSGPQYNILRRGGTERQRSSILHTFSALNAGTYLCAGCRTPLFASADKFDSRTGWPSFSACLDGGGGGVETEDLDPIRATLDGREVRCGTCGGHLGDLFNDGWVYPGTSAFATGKRYCIDGAALIFKPSNAAEGASEVGEADLIYGDQPPPNKVIRYESPVYRDAA